MNDPEHMIYFLLGLLQCIAIGMTAWALLTLVKVLERLAKLEGKFDEFPVQMISNNRHRIEQLERHQEGQDHKIATMQEHVKFFHKNEATL